MITAYCLWAFENAAETGDDTWFRLSIVPFVLAVLRYALVVEQGGGGAPEEIVLVRPRPPGCSASLWVVDVRARRPWLTRRAARVELLTGWGRTAPTAADGRRRGRRRPTSTACSAAGRRRGLIARGLGRSYGDAAQNAGGTVLDATALDRRPRRRPRATASCAVDAGVSLDALMRALVPLGWFVPGHAGHAATSPSAARSPPTSTARTTTSTAASPTTSSRSRCTRRRASSTVTPDADPELFWGTAGGDGPHRRRSPRRRCGCSRSRRRCIRVDTERCRRPRRRDGAHGRGRRRLPLLGRRGSTAWPRGASLGPVGAVPRRPRAARRAARAKQRARPAALRARTR